MKKLLVVILLLVLTLTLTNSQNINSQNIYDDCTIYGNCIEEVITTNATSINVNSSRFWDTLSLGPLNDANSSQFFAVNNVLNINTTALNLTNGNFLRLDGGNQPSANYNWITDLTTTGNITASNLLATGLTDTGVVFVDTGGVLATEAGPFNWNKIGDFLELNELRMTDNNKIIMGNDISLEIFHSGTSAIISNSITGDLDFESLASGRGFNYFVGGYVGGSDPIIQIGSTGSFTWNPEGVAGPTFSLISSAGTAMTISSANGETSFSNGNFVVGSDGRLRVDLDSATGIRFGEAQGGSVGYNGSDMIYNSQLVGTGDHLFIAGDVEISENLNLPETTSSSVGVINMNGVAFIHSFSPGEAGTNVFVGQQAGNFITTGTGRNIGLGFRALEDITSGSSNVGIGYVVLNKLTTGFGNFGLGTQSLNDLSSGNSNIAIGTSAGFEITTGDDNVFIGRDSALNTAISSARNVYMGRNTGNSVTNTDTDNVDNNVAIGDDAMGDFTGVPTNNVVIGQGAGQLIGGSGNIMIGKDAGALDNTNSNVLYIHNTNTVIPLIFGDFSARELTINGDLNVTGNMTTSDGGVLTSNATCTFLFSPDASTVLEVCNV